MGLLANQNATERVIACDLEVKRGHETGMWLQERTGTQRAASQHLILADY
jgi:hypothetical protein